MESILEFAHALQMNLLDPILNLEENAVKEYGDLNRAEESSFRQRSLESSRWTQVNKILNSFSELFRLCMGEAESFPFPTKMVSQLMILLRWASLLWTTFKGS
jgi:hypothetical protein